MAIKTFRHKGLKKLFESGNKSGVLTAHASRIGRILERLHAATEVKDMNAPGYDFHPLKRELKGIRCTLTAIGQSFFVLKMGMPTAWT